MKANHEVYLVSADERGRTLDSNVDRVVARHVVCLSVERLLRQTHLCARMLDFHNDPTGSCYDGWFRTRKGFKCLVSLFWGSVNNTIPPY